MLYLHHGNDIELLRDALLERLPSFQRGVFEPDYVLVQNVGMKRWLQQAVAARFAVAANIRFPLPSRYVWDLYQTLFADQSPAGGYDTSHLRWPLFELLQSELWSTEYPVGEFVGQDNHGLARFQLAESMADIFDRYQVYRPEMIARWEQKSFTTQNLDEAWQAELWQRLRKRRPEPHRASLAFRLLEKLEQGDIDASLLPPRLFVFALSALSPLYLRVLAGLALHIDVRLFVVNPTFHYWGDLLSRKEQLRRGLEPLAENELLASMGRQGRDFLDQLYELNPQPHEIEHFSEAKANSLLGLLRHNILQFDDARAAPEGSASVQVVSCYSELRELQTLHDYLLDQFQQNPDWQPHDVVVMCPDINRIAPAIEAVFGQQADVGRIPYSISDHQQASTSPLLRTLFEWIELSGSRFSASQVLGWLQVPAVQRAYQLCPDDVEIIAYWIGNLYIHWGLDAQHREQLGFDAVTLNTWTHGINRLLATYVEPPYASPAASAEMVISQAEFHSLGQLQKLLDDLGTWQTQVASPHTPARWLQMINHLVERSLQPDDEEQWLLRSLQDEISQWCDQIEITQTPVTLSTAVVAHLLRQAVAVNTAQAQYLNGAVNFCNLIPMRTLPFKCVCLIGMDDRSFPSGGVATQLDLMASSPRRGDPSVRDDERYMFLQSILAARESLYISYVGRGIQNDQPLEPSVVVSELLDYLEQSMDCKIQIRQTALQPFSEENYQQGSYARLWRSEAPAAVDAEPVEANPKQTEPLETMELSQLQRFFRNPVRYFYQQSLVAHLVELQSAVHDEENFELDQLQQYQLRQMAVEQVLQQGEVDIETLQNSGLLLPGVAGELQVQPLIEAGLAVATALVNDPAYGARQRLDISLPVGQSSIAGNLTSYASDVLLDYNLSRNRGKSRLLLWIGHCALCAQDRIEESRLYHLDGIDRFQILTRDDALGILEDLVAVYQEGLRQPLPMAPNISMNYLPQPTKKGRGGASDSASRLAAIQRSWNGYSPPFEASDAYIKLAFARGLPFDEAFGPLAERVFKPLLEALIDE